MEDWAVLEYELGRFALLDWELHGSSGSHALPLSVFYCVSLVPPSSLSLSLSFPTLSNPFLAFLLQSLNSFSSAGKRRGVWSHHCRWAPWETRLGVFHFCEDFFRVHHLLLTKRRRRCWLSDLLQPWPSRALSCPSARQRGIREGRRHVGTEARGPLHWILLL